MSYINTTTPTRIWINGKEYTEFMVSGSVSDESTLSNSIVKTSGTITLGGVHDSIIVQEFPVPIGSTIIVQCTLPGNRSTRHPRGTLYVVNTTVNYEQQTVTLEVGCSLYLASVYENSFTDRIRSLFNFIPENIDVFDIQNYDFSELGNVLQALGYVMYQDKNGRVQLVSAFRNGFGSIKSSGKFTSYDDSTAISIESLSDTSSLIDPSELTITMDWDIPKFEEEDPEDQSDEINEKQQCPREGGTGGPAEEEIQYVNTKYIKINIFESLDIYDGFTTELNEDRIYQCGKFLNPQYTTQATQVDKCKKKLTKEEWVVEESVQIDYGYAVEGSIKTDENAYFGDTIRKYQYTENEGPGRQMSYEETWEEMSVIRAGDAAISQWFENVSKEYDLVIEEANALSEEMNEYARLKLENNKYAKTAQELQCLSEDEANLMDTTYGFYDCLFSDRAERRDKKLAYAIAILRFTSRELLKFHGWTATTNRRTKRIRFGEGGEVLSVVEKEYIYTGASKVTVDLIKRAGAILEDPEDSGEVIDNRRSDRSGKYNFEPPMDKVLGVWRPREPGDDPGFYVNGVYYRTWPIEFLRAETLEEYVYDGNKVTQKITKVDYENPENNTIDIKVSTDNSTAATAPPRDASSVSQGCEDLDGDGIPNQDDADRDGDGDLNDVDPDPDDRNINTRNELVSCNIPTEARECVYRVSLGNRTQTIGGSWLGGFKPSPEEISMPIGFKPLVPENLEEYAEEDMTIADCNQLTNTFIATAKANMLQYEKYINRYLIVEAAKRKMDTRGVRVVEKMRTELFEYYPFMPLTIVINANKERLLARSSAATWAFDSTNALCSLDCYVYNT